MDKLPHRSRFVPNLPWYLRRLMDDDHVGRITGQFRPRLLQVFGPRDHATPNLDLSTDGIQSDGIFIDQ